MKGKKIQTAFLVFGWLIISSGMALAQRPAQPELPPDQRAYGEAIRVVEPQKRLDALAGFLRAFPSSRFQQQANQEILRVLVKNWPAQTERIMAQAKKLVDTPYATDKYIAHFFVARQLVDARLLLDQAEEFATKGLALINEEQRRARAFYLGTLGRVYLERNKIEEATRILNEAYAGNPLLLEVAIDLAKLEFNTGKYQAAFDHLATLALKGRMTADSRHLLESAYRKLHGGSLDGLEALLDKKYEEIYPSPIKTKLPRSNRVVLAEVFTGSSCPPCVAADLAFDAIMERYPRNDVAVLMYHQHIPAPDPMANPISVARGEFYQIGGVPKFAIDGELSGGGGDRTRTQEVYSQIYVRVEKRLEAAAEAEINLEADLSGAKVQVKAVVDKVGGESINLRLHLALAEDRLRFNGENTIRFHPMVVRSLGGIDGGGFAVSQKQPTIAEHTFDLDKLSAELKTYLDDYEAKNPDLKPFIEKKHLIDRGNLSVIAFVQNEKSKQILQAVYLKVKPVASALGSAR
jgi:thiol-disulfide isomerase/thioredoxin